MKTTKGLKVVYIQKAYHPKSGTYQGWTARIRVIEGDPSQDEYGDFNSDGTAFKHEFGNVNLSEVG